VFALCGDDEVDPNFAVKELERIAAYLEDLEPQMKQAFINKVYAEAKRESEAGNVKRAEELQRLPEDMELLE
jgi:ABC-type Zn uptake system ZnuABC Zn-binding protein ZnuA